ncbi:MAG: hydrogenase maturation nickel metallochaperone HypA [Chloroflexi bacterium]|nr:hydrogenase maturation nickel metallochaperone HypA [Chloroflexota bacterium]
MHELSVTENILQITLKHAQQAGAKSVTDVHLVIGELSSIIDDSVQFYWDMITENTICDSARLHFTRIPAKMRCQNCKQEFTIENGPIPCPSCGSMNVRVFQGEEFWVESIEIQKEE